MRLQLFGIEDGVVKVDCDGDITSYDLLGEDPLAKMLGSASFVGTLVLGLGRVSFIDSAGIGWLLGTHRRLAGAGGKLVVHSVNPRVLQMFTMLHLSSLLHIAKDESEAQDVARRVSNGN